MRTILLGAMLLMSGSGFAGEAPSPFQRLKAAPRFTIGPVGFAAMPAREEKAFRALLRGPKAPEQFGKLLSEATPAGQLYALLGLKLLKDPAYEKAYPRYAANEQPVSTMSGCIVMQTTVDALARQIGEGKFK